MVNLTTIDLVLVTTLLNAVYKINLTATEPRLLMSSSLMNQYALPIKIL